MRQGESNAFEPSFPRGGCMPHHTRPRGEAPGSVKREKEQSRSRIQVLQGGFRGRMGEVEWI